MKGENGGVKFRYLP